MWTVYSQGHQVPGCLIKQNRTKNQSNAIEHQWFNCVRQSNIIEHLILCEFDYRTNRTNRTKSSAIEQNRTQSNRIWFDFVWTASLDDWVRLPTVRLSNVRLSSIANHSIIERSIVFDCRPFDNRTFNCVRLTTFFNLWVWLLYVRLPNTIERLVFDFVWLPNVRLDTTGIMKLMKEAMEDFLNLFIVHIQYNLVRFWTNLKPNLYELCPFL